MGTELNSYNTFMILSLVSALRTTVSWNIARPMNLLADFAVALSRIQGILEFENDNIHKYLQDTFADVKSVSDDSSEDQLKVKKYFDDISRTMTHSGKDHAILLKNVVCSWTGKWNKLTLKSLNLTAKTGDLVVITGPVGCGKSSLLYAILGEISLFTGSISYQSKIAWVSQQPWVFYGTVRDNILFGEKFDLDRYRMTLEACDLYKDLQRFPDGDMTRVGERGIVLSGGQRARVELARAVYFNADIYLLDDPLSSIDTKVGQHIFKRCICGLLHGKTRLMITHNLQILRDAENIVVMKDGSVSARGSFTSLCESDLGLKGIENCTATKETFNILKEKPFTQEKSASETTLDEEIIALENTDEDRAVGSISWKLYWHYIQSGMSAILVGVTFIFILLVQGWLVIFPCFNMTCSAALNSLPRVYFTY